tara:strand:- start:129 stop:1046 length:918 start_codon:yes stop_codon:yes gene_type:complete
MWLLLISSVKAQELTIPTYTQYLADNPFVISPAYAGIGDHVKLRVNGLTQWVGVKDAPEMQSLVVDTRLGQRSGIGLFLYNDSNGFTHQKGAKISYAHHLILNERPDQFLSFGLSYNLNQFRIDTEEFNVNDPSIENDRKLTNHNFDVAALYRFEDFYFSFNANNILPKKEDDFGINEPLKLRNYQVYTGYVIKQGRQDKFEIEPSAYIQYFESDQRSTTDINLKFRFFDYEDYYWAGLSYRFINDQAVEPLNISPMIGLKKSNFYFAYSYQVTTNEFVNNNSGTHMVTLGLNIFQGISNCACTL